MYVILEGCNSESGWRYVILEGVELSSMGGRA